MFKNGEEKERDEKRRHLNDSLGLYEKMIEQTGMYASCVIEKVERGRVMPKDLMKRTKHARDILREIEGAANSASQYNVIVDYNTELMMSEQRDNIVLLEKAGATMANRNAESAPMSHGSGRRSKKASRRQ